MRSESLSFLTRLLETPTPSGFEAPGQRLWMDYVKPVGIRLTLQVFTILWLLGCAGWTVQILWRV